MQQGSREEAGKCEEHHLPSRGRQLRVEKKQTLVFATQPSQNGRETKRALSETNDIEMQLN